MTGHVVVVGSSAQAVAARRLGAEVRLVAVIASDPPGEARVGALRAGGVDVRAVRRGDRPLRPDDVEGAAPLFAGAAVVVASLAAGVETAARALALGRRYGARTVLKPGPAEPLPAGLLPLADSLVPDASELERLVGSRASSLPEIEAAARSLLATGAGEVIVTLGERGVLRVTRLVSALERPPGAAALEPSGAGDAFVGALAAALAAGLDTLGAIAQASRAAARCVTRTAG